MPPLNVHDLPIEVLEAFLGKKSLRTASAHFSSRQELIRTYASFMASTLNDPKVIQEGRCTCCGNPERNSVLLVNWKAPTRIHWLRLVRFSIFFPLFIYWALHHPVDFVLGPRGLSPFADYLRITTRHPVCGKCRDHIENRIFLYGVLATLALVLLVTSGLAGALAVMGIVLQAVVGQFQGIWKSVQLLLLALAGASAAIMLLRFGKKLLLPKSVRRLVKRPFVLVSREILNSF
jgi:hypothetical protein